MPKQHTLELPFRRAFWNLTESSHVFSWKGRRCPATSAITSLLSFRPLPTWVFSVKLKLLAQRHRFTASFINGSQHIWICMELLLHTRYSTAPPPILSTWAGHGRSCSAGSRDCQKLTHPVQPTKLTFPDHSTMMAAGTLSDS